MHLHLRLLALNSFYSFNRKNFNFHIKLYCKFHFVCTSASTYFIGAIFKLILLQRSTVLSLTHFSMYLTAPHWLLTGTNLFGSLQTAPLTATYVNMYICIHSYAYISEYYLLATWNFYFKHFHHFRSICIVINKKFMSINCMKFHETEPQLTVHLMSQTMESERNRRGIYV